MWFAVKTDLFLFFLCESSCLSAFVVQIVRTKNTRRITLAVVCVLFQIQIEIAQHVKILHNLL